ncbi:MAG: diversity-generating retroelement protein Avd [Phycisphaerae bacterium]|nr:diversity-generating retroelement protein Avd [Phycisphaerae bacterium]
MANELKIIQDFYDFMLWMIKHIEKYPRHHRYSLGLAMESRMQKILELLLKAKYHRGKNDILSDANIELEILRFQLRISKDLKILTVKSYGYGSKCLLEVGSQAGGWLKSK